MRVGYELAMEQIQKLSMTPELIQSIQILQFNSQELSAYVQNALLENPILESEKLYEEPQVEIQKRLKAAVDDENRYKQWEYTDHEEAFSLEQYATQKETLTDFLLEQLQLSDLNAAKKEICRYVIEAIDDNGYLTVTIEEIADALGKEKEKVEAALHYVQSFEPAGVGARNLQECLLIQLASKGLLTEEMEYLIMHMLQDLAQNRVTYIGRTLGLSHQQVQQLSDLIKSLDPKPGRAFAIDEEPRYIVPDIIVERMNDEFVVTNYDGSLPHLMISSYYYDLTEQRQQDEALEKYLTEKYHAAMWLIKSIAQRKKTIYKVAESIVRHQQDFFEQGEHALKPLTLKEIAEDVGVHESTVSRTIHEKYLQSSRGVFELKFFFSSGVEGEWGGISSNSVKSIIREIISKEDPKKPYSDQDMVAILAQKGIAISRRTVAKYREAMHILSSSKRRRY